MEKMVSESLGHIFIGNVFDRKVQKVSSLFLLRRETNELKGCLYVSSFANN